MAAAAPARGRISGNIAVSSPASRPSRVDWRRSARDDHLYVREQEWEAAHTVWIWPDRSPSMAFSSRRSRYETKLDRALVMAFALAEFLVEGGERVGVPGLTRPTGARNVIDKIAQAMIHDPAARPSLPTNFAPSPLAEIVLLSDLWSPIADIRHDHRPALGHRSRRAISSRSSTRPRRPSPMPAASSSSNPEGAGSITAGRAETWRHDYAARDRASPRRNPRRDRPPRLELHHPPHRPAGDRTPARAA